MFDMPVKVPDRISTLELSKIWLYKALQELQQELQTGNNQDNQAEDEDSSG